MCVAAFLILGAQLFLLFVDKFYFHIFSNPIYYNLGWWWGYDIVAAGALHCTAHWQTAKLGFKKVTSLMKPCVAYKHKTKKQLSE